MDRCSRITAGCFQYELLLSRNKGETKQEIKKSMYALYACIRSSLLIGIENVQSDAILGNLYTTKSIPADHHNNIIALYIYILYYIRILLYVFWETFYLNGTDRLV